MDTCGDLGEVGCQTGYFCDWDGHCEEPYIYMKCHTGLFGYIYVCFYVFGNGISMVYRTYFAPRDTNPTPNSYRDTGIFGTVDANRRRPPRRQRLCRTSFRVSGAILSPDSASVCNPGLGSCSPVSA